MATYKVNLEFELDESDPRAALDYIVRAMSDGVRLFAEAKVFEVVLRIGSNPNDLCVTEYRITEYLEIATTGVYDSGISS